MYPWGQNDSHPVTGSALAQTHTAHRQPATVLPVSAASRHQFSELSATAPAGTIPLADVTVDAVSHAASTTRRFPALLPGTIETGPGVSYRAAVCCWTRVNATSGASACR